MARTDRPLRRPALLDPANRASHDAGGARRSPAVLPAVSERAQGHHTARQGQIVQAESSYFG